MRLRWLRLQIPKAYQALPTEHLLVLAAGAVRGDPCAIVDSHAEAMKLRTDMAYKVCVWRVWCVCVVCGVCVLCGVCDVCGVWCILLCMLCLGWVRRVCVSWCGC